jgi:hypothetical protein
MRGLTKIKFIMHEKGKMLVDGLGAERIVEEILKYAYIKY